MSLHRVLVTTRPTLSYTFRVDGVATDATGNVTATLTRLDGTVVDGPVVAGHPGPAGLYTYLPPAQALVDTCTLTWSGTFGGSVVVLPEGVEFVGAYIFGLAEARAKPPPLSAAQHTDAAMAIARVGVEQEAERIAGLAFVPRFARVQLSGNGRAELVTPTLMIRRLRAVRVDGVAWTQPQIDAVGVGDSGVLNRSPAGYSGAVWPLGVRNIVVEYEHGLDYPPEEVRDAAMVRLRYRLAMGDTSVPYRATSYTHGDGGTYRLATPDSEHTGMPDVDAAYHGAGLDAGGFA